MHPVFDRVQIARQRKRTAASPDKSFFLFDWATDQISDRMGVIKKTFPKALCIGARGKLADLTYFGVSDVFTIDNNATSLKDCPCYVVCEEDFLPFKDNAFDLVFSSLNLHTVNDLPGALLQIRRSLKPDGLFIAAMLGGETLRELRQCLQEAELEVCGGVTPRVAPFADKQQMGALLQRAGFSLPVIDSDIITVTYESMMHLMQDLKDMGEGNAVTERKKSFSSRALFAKAAQFYQQKFSEKDGRIRASFEIIFLLGWSPHASQQKPLRPGSAQNRLAEALNTFEISAEEKTQ